VAQGHVQLSAVCLRSEIPRNRNYKVRSRSISHQRCFMINLFYAIVLTADKVIQTKLAAVYRSSNPYVLKTFIPVPCSVKNYSCVLVKYDNAKTVIPMCRRSPGHVPSITRSRAVGHQIMCCRSPGQRNYLK